MKKSVNDKVFDKLLEYQIRLELIKMFISIGIDAPTNLEDIFDFVINDIREAADSSWNSEDIRIAFRRWIEKQGKK